MGRRWPSPSQSSLRGGWKAAGPGRAWGGASASTWLRGGFVSLHVGMVGATILSQQAGRECLHGSMTEQSGPAGDEGC